MLAYLGILALAVAFLLGAQFGRAEYVDHSTTGIIAHMNGVALLDNGQVYCWNRTGSGGNGAWVHYEPQTPPVPVSQIKFWESGSVITTANELWLLDGQWWNCGSPPMGGVATQPSTWGQIKAQFKK